MDGRGSVSRGRLASASPSQRRVKILVPPHTVVSTVSPAGGPVTPMVPVTTAAEAPNSHGLRKRSFSATKGKRPSEPVIPPPMLLRADSRPPSPRWPEPLASPGRDSSERSAAPTTPASVASPPSQSHGCELPWEAKAALENAAVFPLTPFVPPSPPPPLTQMPLPIPLWPILTAPAASIAVPPATAVVPAAPMAMPPARAGLPPAVTAMPAAISAVPSAATVAPIPRLEIAPRPQTPVPWQTRGLQRCASWHGPPTAYGRVCFTSLSTAASARVPSRMHMAVQTRARSVTPGPGGARIGSCSVAPPRDGFGAVVRRVLPAVPMPLPLCPLLHGPVVVHRPVALLPTPPVTPSTAQRAPLQQLWHSRGHSREPAVQRGPSVATSAGGGSLTPIMGAARSPAPPVMTSYGVCGAISSAVSSCGGRVGSAACLTAPQRQASSPQPRTDLRQLVIERTNAAAPSGSPSQTGGSSMSSRAGTSTFSAPLLSRYSAGRARPRIQGSPVLDHQSSGQEEAQGCDIAFQSRPVAQRTSAKASAGCEASRPGGIVQPSMAEAMQEQPGLPPPIAVGRGRMASEEFSSRAPPPPILPLQLLEQRDCDDREDGAIAWDKAARASASEAFFVPYFDQEVTARTEQQLPQAPKEYQSPVHTEIRRPRSPQSQSQQPTERQMRPEAVAPAPARWTAARRQMAKAASPASQAPVAMRRQRHSRQSSTARSPSKTSKASTRSSSPVAEPRAILADVKAVPAAIVTQKPDSFVFDNAAKTAGVKAFAAVATSPTARAAAAAALAVLGDEDALSVQAATQKAVAAHAEVGDSSEPASPGSKIQRSPPEDRGWTRIESRNMPGIWYWYHEATGTSQFAMP